MLQRIQSVYFAIAFALVVAFGFTYESWISPENYGHIIAGLLAGITAALLVGAVFLYKNRSQQMNLAKAAQWASLVWLAFVVFVVYKYNVVQAFFETGSAWKIALLAIPILVYILVGLGRKAIRSDIELLKSADRIR